MGGVGTVSASKKSVEAAVAEEATYGALPLTKKERVWGAGDFSWVTISLAIATWAFLTGGSTVLLVGFTDGIAAMLIGNSIGLAIMAFGSVVLSQRIGVEQYRALKSVFGIVGVGIVVFTIVLLTEMGWTSLLGVLFGRAFTEISNQAFGTGFDTYGPIVTVFALLAILIGWIVLSRGPVTISKLNRFVAPGLIVVVGFMMVMLMSQNSWADLLAAPPVAPFEDEQLNFMMAVEFNLGAGLSWWPVMGTLARLTRGPRAAVWASWGGLFIGTVLAQIVGMAAGLMLGDPDPDRVDGAAGRTDPRHTDTAVRRLRQCDEHGLDRILDRAGGEADKRKGTGEGQVEAHLRRVPGAAGDPELLPGVHVRAVHDLRAALGSLHCGALRRDHR